MSQANREFEDLDWWAESYFLERLARVNQELQAAVQEGQKRLASAAEGQGCPPPMTKLGWESQEAWVESHAQALQTEIQTHLKVWGLPLQDRVNLSRLCLLSIRNWWDRQHKVGN